MQGNRDINDARGTAALSNTHEDASRRLTLSGLTAGFLPAFRHRETGEVRLCGLLDGHLLDDLPDQWVIERDRKGRPSALAHAIEAGFLRGIAFWALGDFSRPTLDG